MMTVAHIGQVYVKATQFLQPTAVEVDTDGIRHDRAFALLEADDRFVPSDRHADFLALRFAYDAATDRLCLHLPDGRRIDGPALADGQALDVDLHGLRTVPVREVGGPWAATLSEHAGRPVRLVRCLGSTAIDVFPVTFVTTGSLARLAQEVGGEVDPARFRAGFVIDHAEAHAEDGWDGRHLRLGDVVLKVRTAVPRCAITGMNPTSGARDQDVMRGLIRYRPKTALPDGLLPGYATPGFATYAAVVEPGRVRVGDRVELLD
ncbi:MAG: MOSC domain-containing protein [Gammaproteobacteria bacterium]|nr:MOSC domain-containing protein [Gammaproteobacteria bacterium]